MPVSRPSDHKRSYLLVALWGVVALLALLAGGWRPSPGVAGFSGFSSGAGQMAPDRLFAADGRADPATRPETLVQAKRFSPALQAGGGSRADILPVASGETCPMQGGPGRVWTAQCRGLGPLWAGGRQSTGPPPHLA